MTYYILPKKNNNITLNLILQKEQTFDISNSIFYYIKSLKLELLSYISLDKFKKLKNNIFIYNELLNNNFCSIKTSIDFFIYIELLKISIFSDIYKKINIIYCDEIIYNSFIYTNKNIIFKNTKLVPINKNEFDILSFNIINKNNNTDYLLNFLSILCKIIYYQSNDGGCIIKIFELNYKPIIDIIYILNNFYEKVYIIKPNTSNSINKERYIVCKHMKLIDRDKYYNFFNEVYTNLLKNKEPIYSLLSEELPYYFINKIEDSNLGIGNLMIEQLDLLISIINDNCCIEKIENIKLNNLNKCILWCEKYKVLFKTNEKNIFTNETILCDVIIS